MGNLAIPVENNKLICKNGVIQYSLLTIVDDFEDQNLNEYSGSVSDYTITNEKAVNNSYSLKSNASAKIINDSVTVGQGSTITGYLITPADGMAILQFGVQDFDNNYIINLSSFDTDLTLAKKENDNYSTLDSTYVNPTGEWYKIRIEWLPDNSITCTLYDNNDSLIATVSATDSTFTSGKIGFDCYKAGAYFDYVYYS